MSRPIYIEPKESEEKFQRLSKLGLELGIPVMDVFLTIQVRDARRKVIEHFKQRSHSWTRNAYNMLLCQMAALNGNDSTFGAGKLSIKDTAAGVNYGAFTIGQYTQASLLTANGYNGSSGSNAQGIQFGTDSTAESFEDYHLIGLIANGTGSGQFSYVASQPYAASYDIPSKVWTVILARYANNNSGGSIGVNEVALVGNIIVNNGGHSAIVSRDKLGSTSTVPDSGQIKATYTLTLTYPA